MKLRNNNKQKPTTEPKGELSLKDLKDIGIKSLWFDLR